MTALAFAQFLADFDPYRFTLANTDDGGWMLTAVVAAWRCERHVVKVYTATGADPAMCQFVGGMARVPLAKVRRLVWVPDEDM